MADTATIKRAATMILIRNGESNTGVEVYMTRRPATMLFLPGYYVFPGGVMQREDQDERIFAFCVKQDLEVDLSYAITAIRECYEEVGYLLADAAEDSIPEPVDFHDWIRSQKIRLRTDKMRYYGHRITPRSVSKRRFDTRYFLTIVSRDQQLVPCEKEVAAAEWIDPRIALEQAKRGTFKMVPPTLDALTDLARFESAEDAFRNGNGVGTPRPHELS